MKMQRPHVTMIHSHSAKRIAQVAAAALLICSALARADNCAGGMDASGSACNGGEATHSISEADSRSPYLRGAAAMAGQKVTQAKQRQQALDLAGGQGFDPRTSYSRRSMTAPGRWGLAPYFFAFTGIFDDPFKSKGRISKLRSTAGTLPLL